jgi:hypothetical protein
MEKSLRVSIETIPTQNVLVFKTNLQSQEKIERVNRILNHRNNILRWSVDMEDMDNVLRIEADYYTTENSVISLLSKEGIICTAMTW